MGSIWERGQGQPPCWSGGRLTHSACPASGVSGLLGPGSPILRVRVTAERLPPFPRRSARSGSGAREPQGPRACSSGTSPPSAPVRLGLPPAAGVQQGGRRVGSGTGVRCGVQRLCTQGRWHLGWLRDIRHREAGFSRSWPALLAWALPVTTVPSWNCSQDGDCSGNFMLKSQ